MPAEKRLDESDVSSPKVRSVKSVQQRHKHLAGIVHGDLTFVLNFAFTNRGRANVEDLNFIFSFRCKGFH